MKKKISNKQFAEGLFSAINGLKGEKLHAVLRQFVLLLVKYHKLKQGTRIIAEFEKYTKKQTGIVEIGISSAHKLENTTLEHIKKIFGKQVEAVESVDADLLGGVVIKTDDKILDGSLKMQLLNLKKTLAN